MIIGFETCTPGTSFKTTHAGGGHVLSKISIPLSAMLGTTPVNMADPTIEFGADGRHSQFQRFTTKDEQEYKVVKQRKIFGVYSENAEATVAHNPQTYDWKNAVFDAQNNTGGVEGKFDDEGDEDVPAENVPKKGDPI
jgi:hypothetical protein